MDIGKGHLLILLLVSFRKHVSVNLLQIDEVDITYECIRRSPAATHLITPHVAESSPPNQMSLAPRVAKSPRKSAVLSAVHAEVPSDNGDVTSRTHSANEKSKEESFSASYNVRVLNFGSWMIEFYHSRNRCDHPQSIRIPRKPKAWAKPSVSWHFRGKYLQAGPGRVTINTIPKQS